MYSFVSQIQGKTGRKDGKSFKAEQQRCDARCCGHALCPHVCKCWDPFSLGDIKQIYAVERKGSIFYFA